MPLYTSCVLYDCHYFESKLLHLNLLYELEF